jgi:hypothetical protein
MNLLRREVLQTLLYYDIWGYPLTLRELFAFLPMRIDTFEEFEIRCAGLVAQGDVSEDRGYYYAPGRDPGAVDRRLAGQAHARKLWLMARLSTHVIKRFPFVRAVFVSGDLSKDSTHRESDVDFLILTAPGRLWVARMLLILFKKVILLNRKKYFCLNSFATVERMTVDERNIYQATEVAQLKPLFNSGRFHRYLAANGWIRDFFPNFDISTLPLPKPNDRPSLLQRVIEFPLKALPLDRMDTALLRAMERIWERRYPQFDPETRSRIFRCTKSESRAYVGNFQEKILAQYDAKLRDHGVID